MNHEVCFHDIYNVLHIRDSREDINNTIILVQMWTMKKLQKYFSPLSSDTEITDGNINKK